MELEVTNITMREKLDEMQVQLNKVIEENAKLRGSSSRSPPLVSPSSPSSLAPIVEPDVEIEEDENLEEEPAMELYSQVDYSKVICPCVLYNNSVQCIVTVYGDCIIIRDRCAHLNIGNHSLRDQLFAINSYFTTALIQISHKPQSTLLLFKTNQWDGLNIMNSCIHVLIFSSEYMCS